jgi:hypothetical protein
MQASLAPHDEPHLGRDGVAQRQPAALAAPFDIHPGLLFMLS